MKLQFRRRKVEIICTYTFYVLMIAMAVLFILYRADAVFNWNIMSPNVQRYVESLFIPAIVFFIVGAFVLSFIINISLISSNLERIADSLEEKKNKDDEDRH